MKSIAIDPGAGAIKLYGENGGIQLPSIIAVDGAERVSRLAGLKTSTPPMQITTDAGSFLVGPSAHEWGRPIENLDHDRFTGAPEMEGLLCAAMAKVYPHGMIGESLRAIVGLPLDVLTGDQAENNANAVKSWLRGSHVWKADNNKEETYYDITISGARVTSQPVGALFDYLLDDQGHYIMERKSAAKHELGIISIGMNTIEMLNVKNMRVIQRFTEGRDVGVRRLLEILNPNDLYSRGEMDMQLRAGSLDIDTALPIWASEVSDAINKCWGKTWQRFERVIVIGGGSIILRHALTTKFRGNAWFPDNPVLSIARGLYKYSLRSK